MAGYFEKYSLGAYLLHARRFTALASQFVSQDATRIGRFDGHTRGNYVLAMLFEL